MLNYRISSMFEIFSQLCFFSGRSLSRVSSEDTLLKRMKNVRLENSRRKKYRRPSSAGTRNDTYSSIGSRTYPKLNKKC